MSDQKLSSASTSEFSQNKHSSFLRRCSISDPRLDILPEKGYFLDIYFCCNLYITLSVKPI